MEYLLYYYLVFCWLIGLGSTMEVFHYTWKDYAVSVFAIIISPITVPISIGIQLQRHWK